MSLSESAGWRCILKPRNFQVFAIKNANDWPYLYRRHLKLFFLHQYKDRKNASDGRILRRKFRLNLCVETTHKLKQFSRLNYKGEILSVPYLYRRKFRLNKIPTDLFVLWFIQSKFSSKTKFSSRRKFRLLYKYGQWLLYIFILFDKA